MKTNRAILATINREIKHMTQHKTNGRTNKPQNSVYVRARFMYFPFIIFIYISYLLITSNVSISLFFIVGVFNYFAVAIFLLF